MKDADFFDGRKRRMDEPFPYVSNEGNGKGIKELAFFSILHIIPKVVYILLILYFGSEI